MTPMQVHAALDTLTLLVDTREQPTARFAQRMAAAGLPYTRKKLDFGDYSARCTLEDGRELDLSGSVAIERKMNLDELCQCYTRDRRRFEREFQRAQSKGAKLYLIVENGSWEKAMQGHYRSRMDPHALLASMTAWLARYRCQVLFCQPETTGALLREILYQEAKERLEGGNLGGLD